MRKVERTATLAIPEAATRLNNATLECMLCLFKTLSVAPTRKRRMMGWSVNNELGKRVEGIGHVIMGGNIPAFAYWNEENLENPRTEI
jgi:hypothetical protein